MSHSNHNLLPAFGIEAASDLLSSLRSCRELAPYILPDLWIRPDQHSAISALCSHSGISIVVSRGLDSLPAAGQQKQGGLINIGLIVYVFQSSTSFNPALYALREQIWLTVCKYVAAWAFSPSPTQKPIRAIQTDTASVDLSGIAPDFADKVWADALLIDGPLQLSPNSLGVCNAHVNG